MTLARTFAGIITVSGDIKASSLDNVGSVPGVGSAVYSYDSAEQLPLSNNDSGDMAFVNTTNRLYLWNGVGWYNVALINNAPRFTVLPNGSYDLSDSAVGQSVEITLLAADSEGVPITYSAVGDANFNTLANVTNVGRVYTIDPLSKDSAVATSGLLTFKASDGVNIGTATATFTLTFSFYPLQIANSLKFNDDESPRLSLDPIGSPTDAKKVTISFWLKRGNLGSTQYIFTGEQSNIYYDLLWFDTSNKFNITGQENAVSEGYITTAVFRDTSAFYHFVVELDSTLSTAADRVKIYVNGVLQDKSVRSGYTAYNQNHEFYYNKSGNSQNIGRSENYGNSFDGYLSNIHFIDGQALAPTNFGEFKESIWIPKVYNGTYGTNGFHLPFKNDDTVEGFNAVTWRATGATQSISGLGFEPDLVWSKRRDASQSHSLFDTVRGAQLVLYSDYTGGDDSLSSSLLSFDGDGFTVGSGNGAINNSGGSYVSWAWDAGENNAPTGHSSVTYTGTGTGSGNVVTGLGFEPDLVWIKRRNTGDHHMLYDSVRYPNNPKQALSSSLNYAESSITGDDLDFVSDGFEPKSSNAIINGSGSTYVAWAWDAGSGSPVSNTDGSITSTVKANPATGFSITSFVGNGTLNATVGHGLSSAPEMVLVKNRSTAVGWLAWHKDLSGATYRMDLNGTGAEYNDGNGALQGVSSSLITLGSLNAVNQNSANMICYAFHSVAGYSSIGSYTGTGASGNAINCGFRPGFVMIKKSSASGAWSMFDANRGDSDNNYHLLANGSDAEYTDQDMIITSTGFTVGGTGGSNHSGETFIYMAFKGSYIDSVSDVNTDGTIDSRVKANPATGFSVISYIGNGLSNQNAGHGLSQKPEMTLWKNRDEALDWFVYHTDVGPSSRLSLNSTIAAAASGGIMNNTDHTNTLLSIGNGWNVNKSGSDIICYAFHSVAGYSSFGSYTGNGSASGPTVTTGFPVAFVMIKRTDGVGGWYLKDNTRNPSGEQTLFLDASDADAEATGAQVTFSSTGFQVTNPDAGTNASGGTYIYMAFADTREAAFWRDTSGNDNNWTPNNLDYRDSLPDSTTNNFATFSPLVRRSDVTTLPTFSEGNLKVVYPDAGGNVTYAAGTIPITSGKWYYETKIDSLTSNNVVVGWATEDEIAGASSHVMIYSATGGIYIDGSLQSTEGALSVGDIIGTTIDLDNGYVGFYKNGVALSTSPSISITSANWWNSGKFLFAWNRGSTSDGTSVNFGQDSTFAGATTAGGNADTNGNGDFKYAPPSGYLALCTANIPTPTIIDGSKNFVPYLYTADDTSPKSRTGLGFSPDFLWFKDRTTGFSNGLYDTIRGPNKQLQTNNTSAENSYTLLPSFDADGFTTQTDGTAGNVLNYSTDSYVTWAWKAGGTPTATNSAGVGAVPTTGSVLIDGVASTSALAGTIAANKITANTAAGFSIINYTGNGLSGQTVAHSLSSTPEFLIMKDRGTNSNNGQWQAWHLYAGDGDDYGYLSTTSAFTGDAQIIPNGTDTIELKANLTTTNQSGHSFIMYAFHSVDGYSRAGSFVGNGSTDGTFVYTGFRPAWIMAKDASVSGQEWTIYDAKRDPSNVVLKLLSPTTSGAEATAPPTYDFLSNGFKLRSSDARENRSGSTYIYLAFAETPFKYANAR